MSTARRMRIEAIAEAGQVEEISLLTTGLARGDDEAFRQFHRSYFDRLFRYLIVVTRGDEDAARDALQETFTRVARHARQFDSADVFWSWLTTVARSVVADGRRRRSSYWRMLVRYTAFLTAATEPPPNDHSEERLDDVLQRAIMDLPEHDRALIEGKYSQRNSVRDLAAQSRVTEKAIESRLVRIRRELRAAVLKLLKDEERS